MLEHAAHPDRFATAHGVATPLYAAASPFDDLAAMHAAYQPRIFRFLLFSLRDPDLAASLTQDTFLNAWRARASFRGDCAPATWLMRIAVNLLRSHTRAEAFRFWKRAARTSIDVADVPLETTAGAADARLIARERLTAVWDAVEHLADGQRTVFLLRFVEELDLPEIAAATGLAVPTVKSHLYRAMDHVRRAAQPAIPPAPAKKGNRP